MKLTHQDENKGPEPALFKKWNLRVTDVVVKRCSFKKVFSKVLENLQKNSLEVRGFFPRFYQKF